MCYRSHHSILEAHIWFVFFCGCLSMYSQQTNVRGKVIDAITGENLAEVIVKIKDTDIKIMTNVYGEFDFYETLLPLGEQIVVVSKEDYFTKRFPIVINEGDDLDLKEIELSYDFSKESLSGTILLSDYELEEEISGSVSPLLHATRDVFLNATSYDFSATFFRTRGLENKYRKILINGIEMNTLGNGRPEWGNWGGLNDVQRKQEYARGISQNEYIFGGLLGTSNISMKASQYRKGSRVSYAMSNRSYQGRLMATYNSGLTKKGWAFSISLSKRYGEQGYIEGTQYDANSFFVSVEKKWGRRHALNLTGFYTPIRRGRSTAITEEVANLKGRTYNPNWGYLDGKIRNSRERRIEQPVVMANYHWNITKQSSLQTNFAFQTGIISNSGIDTGGSDILLGSIGEQTFVGGGRSANTNPVHPENLPSSFLQDENPTPLDYQKAFLATQNLIDNGQVNWDDLVKANHQNKKNGYNATYMVNENQKESRRMMSSIILSNYFNKHITLNTAVHYQNESSQNFAKVKDLLGGTGFLDIDVFALSAKELPSTELVNRAQSDLRNPNRIVRVGDRYDYNYEMSTSKATAFLQGQFKFKKIDFFVSTTASQTLYQRTGLFENGYFPNKASFGNSEQLDFINYGAKAGITYSINGHHFIKLHGAYLTKAPTIRNTFINVRQNNTTIAQLQGKNQESEKIESADASYILRSPKIKAQLTGYFTRIADISRVSSFFTEAIAGSDTGFVQEILTGIDQLHIGGELGIEYQITPTIKLKGVAAIGNFTFDNNPNVTLTSTSETFIKDNGIQNLGKSKLKGYHIAAGPQRAAQLGFEYRDPSFWWFGVTTNYFSHAFINSSSFARTSNFYKDVDGLPFNEYDKNIAKDLLKQEQFESYFLVNAIGGKSWKIKKYYLGFFASANNILNQKYRTGGFEQARNANYRLALEESKRNTPVYGPKYFYGLGTTYYLTIYLRL